MEKVKGIMELKKVKEKQIVPLNVYNFVLQEKPLNNARSAWKVAMLRDIRKGKNMKTRAKKIEIANSNV